MMLAVPILKRNGLRGWGLKEHLVNSVLLRERLVFGSFLKEIAEHSGRWQISLSMERGRPLETWQDIRLKRELRLFLSRPPRNRWDTITGTDVSIWLSSYLA
jgi:hypothetical protein